MKGQGPKAYAKYTHSPQGLLVFAKDFADKLEKNPVLSSSNNPTLAVFKVDVASFDAAQTKQHKTPADVADRDAKALKVHQHVGHLVDWVQFVSDAQPTPAESTALILTAGLSVWKPGKRENPELAAKYTGVQGEVQLVARAGRGAAAFYFEHSLDQQAWTASPETTSSKKVITGLTPGQLVFFRFRTLTNKGKSDYSVVVSLIVH